MTTIMHGLLTWCVKHCRAAVRLLVNIGPLLLTHHFVAQIRYKAAEKCLVVDYVTVTPISKQSPTYLFNYHNYARLNCSQQALFSKCSAVLTELLVRNELYSRSRQY